jgi:uncharacterized membrane protein
MSEQPEPLVRRETWNRSDKVLWLYSIITFFGLPCTVALPILICARVWWAAAVVGVLFVAFGIYIWRYRARDDGKLLIEVTADGIRFQDDQEPVPWTAVAWVGFRVTAPSLHRSSSTYVVLQLEDGPQVEHQVNDMRQDVRSAIRRLAPQVRLSTAPWPRF